MTPSPEAATDRVLAALTRWPERPMVLGICGAQGSGKSTLASAIKARLEGQGLSVALLSLDDLYLAPNDRPVAVSPLFATRGVPGTHDVAQGIAVLDALRTGGTVRLPRFDKARDAPTPEAAWPEVKAPAVILFEGWCVGAKPQDPADLSTPVNDLERDGDPDGAWRQHVNAQLAGPYAALFARIDRLILLAAPGFEVVRGWRTQQEHDLSRMLERAGRLGEKVMSDDQVAHFVQHYERLTRYILNEMPSRADLTLRLGPDRTLT